MLCPKQVFNTLNESIDSSTSLLAMLGYGQCPPRSPYKSNLLSLPPKTSAQSEEMTSVQNQGMNFHASSHDPLWR
jgi:hypothetical protein